MQRFWMGRIVGAWPRSAVGSAAQVESPEPNDCVSDERTTCSNVAASAGDSIRLHFNRVAVRQTPPAWPGEPGSRDWREDIGRSAMPLSPELAEMPRRRAALVDCDA